MHTTVPMPALRMDVVVSTVLSHRCRTGRRYRNVVGVALRRGGEDWPDAAGGGMVDEDMVTLRRRIREVRAAEDGHGLPADWTEWEKRHHESYVAGVCEAVGVLQALLMSARPGLGAGLVALVLLSVPTSVFFVSVWLVETVSSISSALMNGK